VCTLMWRFRLLEQLNILLQTSHSYSRFIFLRPSPSNAWSPGKVGWNEEGWNSGRSRKLCAESKLSLREAYGVISGCLQSCGAQTSPSDDTRPAVMS
jgi:hypothetical protein